MTSVAPEDVDAIEAALSLGIILHWAMKSGMPKEHVERHYQNIAKVIRSQRFFSSSPVRGGSPNTLDKLGGGE